jgi:hypothetical protein
MKELPQAARLRRSRARAPPQRARKQRVPPGSLMDAFLPTIFHALWCFSVLLNVIQVSTLPFGL